MMIFPSAMEDQQAEKFITILILYLCLDRGMIHIHFCSGISSLFLP